MSRRAAGITHDEVVRMLKAARSLGLSIGSFSYDGDRVDVVINNGDSGESAPTTTRQEPPKLKLIREPKL